MRLNLVTNPSFENNTTGWTGVNNAAISSSADHAWTGTKSQKVVYDTISRAVEQTGTSIANFSMTSGTTYTFSAYVWVPTGMPNVRIKFGGPSINVIGGISSTHDQWERISVTATAGSSFANAYLYILNNEASVANSVGFYVDGAMMETAAAPPGTYFDGSFGGDYTWTGTAHNSTSMYLSTSGPGSLYTLNFSDTSVGPTMDYMLANGKMRVDTDVPSGVGATKSLSWVPLQNINDDVSVSMPVTMASDGYVRFYRKVSSENNFDNLKFFIDGVQQTGAEWSGTVAWGQVSYPVYEGFHTLRWTFHHDGSGWAGSNTAWLALIEITKIDVVPPDHYSSNSAATFNFEDGLIPSRVITSSWTNSTSSPISGTRSMRSPVTTANNSIYDLTIDTLYIPENAVISFDYKRDAEGPDRLYFIVDGVTIWPTASTSNTTTDNGSVHWVLAPGTSSFVIRYQKDSSTSAGADAAWIDNLVLPYYYAPPFTPVTNLITNPDAEVDTTGWSATAGTLTRQTNRWVNGTACFQLSLTNPSAALACTAYTTVTGLTVGQTYTFSGYVIRPSGNTAVQLFVNDGGTYTYSAATIFTGAWEHAKVTFTAATTSVNVGVTNTAAISTTTLICCDTMTLVQGTGDEPFSPYTPARSGVTFKPTGAINASPTIKSTGRINLAKNPRFNTGKWGWNGTPDAGTQTWDATNGLYGPGCLKSTATSTFHRVRGSNGAANIAEMIPVTPGKRYVASIWGRSVGGQTSYNMKVTGANSAGTATAAYAGGPTTTVLENTWVRLTVSFTVVAGDAYVYPWIDGLASNGYSYYWDGFMVEEAGGNTDLDKIPAYFDGDDTSEDWVTNVWTGTPNASTSMQVPNPAWVRPQVLGVYDSAASTTTTTTVDLTAAPAPGDVLLLLGLWSTVQSYPPPTSVTGCGATWTKVDGGTDYAVAWVGTGATSSGTITLTHTAVTARAARLYHTRGTTADALMLAPSSSHPLTANPNQIAIGFAEHAASTTDSSLVGGSRKPYYGWVNSPDIWMTSTRRAMTASYLPSHTRDIYHIGTSYGGVLVLGSPVQGYTVKRRNPIRNSSLQATTSWSSTIIPTTSVTSPVFAGSRAIGGTASSTGAAIVSQTSGLTTFGAIKGGRNYTASIYVYCNQAARTAAVRLNWKGSGLLSISTTAWSAAVTLTQNAWTRVTGTFTAPDDARYAALDAQINVTSGDLAYVDAALIDEGDTALPYFDGASTPDPGELIRFSGQWDYGTRYPYFYESLQLAPIPPIGAAIIKVREAGAWVVKTPVAKSRIDGAWVTADLRYWTGEEWLTA